MDVGDLARLTNLTSASMVEVLRARFAGDIVYTYITNMLLAVNPHKPLPIYGLCLQPENWILLHASIVYHDCHRAQ